MCFFVPIVRFDFLSDYNTLIYKFHVETGLLYVHCGIAHESDLGNI